MEDLGAFVFDWKWLLTIYAPITFLYADILL